MWRTAVVLFAAFAMASSVSASSSVPPAPPVDIAVDEGGAAQRLSEAVAIRTISWDDNRPPEAAAFRALHGFLANHYPRVHATLTRETVNEHSLLYAWQGSNAALRPIVLIAHMDVVPIEAETESMWQKPPFSGEIDDGLIWGRGTLDDKITVLGILEAAESLLAEGQAPERTIYFAFGHDEEINGEYGAKAIAALLQSRGIRPEFALDEGGVLALSDVTGAAKPAALIGTAEKGYLSLELVAKTIGGHSSVPRPESAIGILAEAILRLESNPLPAALRDPTSGMLDSLAPEMSTIERFAIDNRWLLGFLLISRFSENPSTNALIRTTMAPTIFQAGVKDNVMPSEARAVVNFRILPGDSIASVVEHVEAVINDARIIVTVLPGANEASPLSSTRSDGYRAIEKTVQQVFPGTVVAPSLVIAATDARHYVHVADDVYRFLPVPLSSADIDRIHGVNERIPIKDYANAIRFYRQFMWNAAFQSKS
jgi:carboxypeptidase PM20D1